jgi:(p)ppGpp synthase/HD superfamily hydrolase
MIGFASSYYCEYIAGSRFIQRRSEYLGKAFNYACVKHEGQLRRSNQEPYFAHCFRVAEAYAKNVPYKLFSEEVYAAALLHDVKEDCNVTNADLITHGFTPRTVELVAGLTRYPWESREILDRHILTPNGQSYRNQPLREMLF